MRPPLYGLLAELETPGDLLAAARRAHEHGYRQLDAFSPFPIEGLAEAVGFHGTRLPALVFCGGLVGGAGGYFMQWYASVVDYPLNIGGRPLHSWPSFIPVTFEMTILAAALTAVLGLFALNGLPMPHHPLFNVARFDLATRDRFFLCIKAKDPKFDRTETARFLDALAPRPCLEVPG